MSNRSLNSDYGHLAIALRFVLRQFRKGLSTALPAKVTEFDAATRRATLEPSIKVRMTGDGEEMSRPPLANVPILFPGGGGYTMLFPLGEDDEVVRLAAERGIAEWKKTFREASASPRSSWLQARNAIGIPSFGPLEITPAVEDGGAIIQNAEGTVYVEIHDDRIKVVKGEQTAEITDQGATVDITGDLTATASGTITLDGDVTVTGTLDVQDDVSVQGDIDVTGDVDGVNVSSHRHSGVTSGGSMTGPPS